MTSQEHSHEQFHHTDQIIMTTAQELNSDFNNRVNPEP